MFSKLQYISQGSTAGEQFNNIHQALDAGCEWIQLRFKNASPAAIQSLAERVKEICVSYGATFIINDHPQIAKDIAADGVHLGLQDMPVGDARKIIGDKIIAPMTLINPENSRACRPPFAKAAPASPPIKA